MPLIVRPPKTAGTNTYQTEVGAGAIDILDTEIDNDFKIVYQAVNGQLDDDNISGAPKLIQGKKIDLSGIITAGDLAPGFTVPPANIAPGSITLPMLGPGASIQDFQSTGGNTPIPLNDTATHLVLDLPFTLRGASNPKFLIIGIISGFMTYIDNPGHKLTALINIGGSAGATDGTPLSGQTVQAQGIGGNNAVAPFNIVVLGVSALPAGGTRAKLIAQQDSLTSNILTYQLIAIQWA